MGESSLRTGHRTIIGFLPIFVIALLLGAYLDSSLNGFLVNNSPTTESLTQFVNPFIGTSASAPYGAGDTFPGATYPMGMVQWSPDTITNPPGGYSYSDSTVTGLSLTHFSGRGCNVYEDFPFMPYVGNISYSPAIHKSLYYSSFSHNSEIAHPGFYRVHLDSPNVTVELSVTLHTGVAEFDFPASTLATIMINAGGSINGNTNSSVSISPDKKEVTGSDESTVGCGTNNYKLYFAAVFDRPFASSGTWNGDIVNHGSNESVGENTGAFLVFDTNSNNIVRVQVGISFVSVENAELNLASENADFNVSLVARNADAAWNSVLNYIRVQGGTSDELMDFYTALYHVFIDPNIFNDVNGQYLGFDGRVHTVQLGHIQYENIAGWDQYRTQIRLLAILAPSVASDISQSLVNDAQQGDGSLPRWEQANADSHGMSGDSGDVIIVEGYEFGATNFDTAGALSAMINGQPQIREGFNDYIKLGYVPYDFQPGLSSASITLEYTTDDFAIAQFAHALGDNSDYGTFLQRSSNWLNIINTSSGYIQPRNSDGTWTANFEPTNQNGFQEGDSAQYTWMVPYNLHGLFTEMGGNKVAVGRLDSFFTKLNDGPVSPYAFMGNEPTFEAPWEYDFAQAPSHTQTVVRQIETQLFNDSPGGLPGNDDGGEMSSWYIFATIGLYPEIPAVAGFVIGSPLFISVSLKLSNGQTLQINAPGASDDSPYVQNLEINNKTSNSLWVPWSEVQNGGILQFSLTNNPSDWGSSVQDSPPSYP